MRRSRKRDDKKSKKKNEKNLFFSRALTSVRRSNAPNGRQFSGERFNLSNLNTRSRSGFINRAIDIALEKRGGKLN